MVFSVKKLHSADDHDQEPERVTNALDQKQPVAGRQALGENRLADDRQADTDARCYSRPEKRFVRATQFVFPFMADNVVNHLGRQVRGDVDGLLLLFLFVQFVMVGLTSGPWVFFARDRGADRVVVVLGCHRVHFRFTGKWCGTGAGQCGVTAWRSVAGGKTNDAISAFLCYGSRSEPSQTRRKRRCRNIHWTILAKMFALVASPAF